MATENLVLGRGKLLFTPYLLNQSSGGERGYFGNTPTLNMVQNVTKLDHYSMEGGLKVKDRSIILQTDVMLNFDTDNISPGNLLLWFGGNTTESPPVDMPGDIGTLSVIGSASQIFGALTFLSDNPIGSNVNYWFPYVSLQPTGTYALKGDAWQTLSFQAEVLKRDNTTERLYTFMPANGVSTAATDTTAQFTTASAGVGTMVGVPATTATLTAPTTMTHGSEYPVTYTLTGGDEAFLFFNNGTTNVLGPITVTGASGTIDITAPAAGTYTAKLFAAQDGSGSALATVATITIS